jgi:hypothetical protein
MDKRSGDIAKIVAVCVLLAAAVGVTWWNFGGESVQPDSFTYVCAKTGKLYSIPRSSAPKILPGENPVTHENTLIPVVREQDGNYYVSERKIDAARQLGDANRFVDLKTRRVTITPGKS